MTTETQAQDHGTEASTQPSVIDIWPRVITQPAAFFRDMPRKGGFTAPLIFMVLAGVAAGLVRAVLSLVGLGHGGSSVGTALASIIVVPILVAIFGFLGAGILYLIWRAMGSERDYETAYRCTAYGSAISPLTQLLLAIPYLGALAGLVWWTLILITASTEVHGIRRPRALKVFGAIAVVLAILSVGSEMAARRMEASLADMQSQLQSGNGQPKDAAQAMQQLGTMLQKVGKATQKDQQ